MADSKQQGPIQPVGRGDKSVDLQKELEALIQKEATLTRQAGEEKKTLDAETLVQISRTLPALIQKRLQKIDAAQVYQTFKLAGTDRIVHDKREKTGVEKEPAQPEPRKTIAQEAKTPLEELVLQKGKYPNYFADPASRMKAPEQQAAEDRLARLFTKFENALLRRFEGGEQTARRAPEGRVSFLKKTAAAWRDFFAHFAKRTVKRRVPVEMVQEWTFRGLVKKEARATVISDLVLANGQHEKFVRFKLAQNAAALAERLVLLDPGTKLPQEALKQQAAKELEYLAIKNAETEAAFTQAPTKGKFLGTAQMEEKVASDLGLQLGEQLKEKQRLLRKAGQGKRGGGGLFGGGEEADGSSGEQPGAFVPWWQFGPLRRHKGPVRWFVILTYIVVISVLFLGLWSMVHGL
ncbi:MAG: hypothetical protein Q8P84_03955 [Deltaproteobacteria bacterium]|nr:hypothetical protein [Deltaproteobacteria bacterium]